MAESEPLLDAFLQHCRDAVWFVDSSGRLARFNPSFADDCLRMTGRAPKVGDLLDDLAPPARQPHLHRCWRELIARARNGESFSVESDFLTAGVKRHFDISAAPVWRDDAVIGAAITMRDTTEWRRSQRHETIELALARIFAENAGPQATLERVLETLCMATGWSLGVAWLADDRTDVLLPSAWWQRPGLTERDLSSAILATRYQKGRGLAGVVWSTGGSLAIDDIFDETEVRRTPFLADVAVREAVVIPLKAGEEILGVVEFFAGEEPGLDKDLVSLFEELGDIVGRYIKGKQVELDRARLQTLLERKSAEWTVTFDAIESPILILSAEGTVLRVNVASMRLAESEYGAVLGRHISAVGGRGPWKVIGEAVDSMRDSNESFSAQMQDPRGRHWDIAATHAPALLGDEKRVIIVLRDVTPVVQLEQSLRRGEQLAAIGELAAGVAHEVRNPLFGISASLDTLQLILKEDRDVEELFGAVRVWVDRLNELMHQLLEYGKSWSINLVPGNLESVIDEAAQLSAPMLLTHGVTMCVDVASLEPMLIDSTRLIQVFDNLIRNAAEQSGTQIELSAAMTEIAGGSWIECTVRDHGGGFRRDDLSRVFQPFFTRRRAGTGLGLSIVQRIVEEHGGSVTAANHPDGGALLRILFPPLPA